ncbi:hypothetical protein BFW87_01795 [Pseudomonas fluorescens]|uniref:Uncharacterized protein n=1 Tax=Pseudomonas fluorescens TaxID=294 RepID=A0A1T2Z8H9_PSEFL|nr:hypothetical protein [Pseudomonas fluorescens]OPB00358.1 hypothetical protein BFW87_01795 [Pseudomonas fluorescens]
MLDLIYIIEEQAAAKLALPGDPEYSPNFTIPGRESALTPSISAMANFGAMSLLLPNPLIMSAALRIPSLFSSLMGDSKNEHSETPQTDLAEAQMLAAYVNEHSMSSSEAKKQGYRFQPGHPVVGKAYRKHPLNDYHNDDNGQLYIPSDSYDAILLEERESELIKLLVHLGATKISITKKATDKTRSTLNAGASVQAGPIGGGELNYKSDTQRDNDQLNTREFSLSGRPWQTNSKIDARQFFWLSYEPSWKAVVFAREEGGCLTASLEIKESTSFSTDKDLELSVKVKLAEGGAHLGMSEATNEEKTYFVRAEFAPVQQNV